MEIELKEIRDFLAQHHPFDTLSEKQLDKLPQDLNIRYQRRGSRFPPDDADDDYLYIVRSGAIELRDSHGHLTGKLAEGGYFTHSCQLVDLDSSSNSTTVEDTLLYLLPCKTLRSLRKSSSEFNRHFSRSLKKSLKRAVSDISSDACNNSISQMTLEVAGLLKKTPVTLDTDSTIQQTALTMSENRISSVMLMEAGKLVGIVTDRDLRKRCVAEAIPVSEPVSRIMTGNPQTIEHDSLVLQAMLTMTRLHVNHLPVIKNGQVVGVLTSTDLTRLNSTNSALVTADIRKATTTEQLAVASSRLPELQVQLANSGATAQHIGDVLSSITDALTGRLIEIAQTELGPAPVPFVWVAGGSQARHEQTSHSDQDNALILSDDYRPEHDGYFAQLAKIVTDGLNDCGFIYCPGDAMASNPTWRQPVAVWREYFHTWIDSPEPMALMLSSIFFDLRPVFGDGSLHSQLQAEVLGRTRENGIFIAYMAANALTHRPPLGFFRNFVLIHDGEHNDTLDIKHRGVIPITDIARVLALSAGLDAVNTKDRLQAAASQGTLSHDMADNLQDALEFIATLRIRHQARQIDLGLQPDNFLPPSSLSELERKHLKDAFKVIQEMQEVLESRYQTGRLG